MFRKITRILFLLAACATTPIAGAQTAGCNPNGSFYSSFTSTARDSLLGTAFPVQAGQIVSVSAQGETSTSTYQATIGLMLTDSSGNHQWIPTTYVSPSSSWQVFSGSITIPSGYVSAQIWIQQNGFTDINGNNPSWGPFYPWYFQNIQITYPSQYPACTDSWVTGSWSPANNCSASVTQTRSVQCESSVGQIVDTANCTGPEPATTQTVSDYSGCTYAWSSGSWGSCSGGSGAWQYSSWTPPTGTYCTSSLSQSRTASCEANANSGTESRSVNCVRSDGTPVSSSYCSSKPEPAASQACTPSSFSCGAEGPLTQTVSDFSGCLYAWYMSAWSAPSSTCSASATESRSGVCQRSDGTDVASSYCASQAEPATSQTVSDYSGCSYSWEASGFGVCSGGSGTWTYTPWSPTCGSGTFTQTRSAACIANAGSGTQNQTVTCQRSDGTTVSNTYCSSASEPASTQNCTPSTGYSCGTEGLLSQSVTMNTVCMAAMSACTPDASKQDYCVVIPLQ